MDIERIVRASSRTTVWSCVVCLAATGCKSTTLASLSPLGGAANVASRGPADGGVRRQLAEQNHQLQSRLSDLNANDEHLHKLLAEAQREASLAKSENVALREQLRGVTAQVERLHSDRGESQQKYESLLASTRRRGGAMIEPNSSLRDDLPALEIPGVDVRRDGDLVRVDISAGRLFAPGGVQLTRDGGKLLEAVVAEIDRRYPDRPIGIEAHTDNQPPTPSSRFANNHEFSLSRANSVFGYLVRYTSLRAEQLSVAGFGGSRPFASNAQAAGQERNRRIELVVGAKR